MTINWLNWSNTGVEWATFNFCERLKVKGNVISKLSLKISKRLQTDDLLNMANKIPDIKPDQTWQVWKQVVRKNFEFCNCYMDHSHDFEWTMLSVIMCMMFWHFMTAVVMFMKVAVTKWFNTSSKGFPGISLDLWSMKHFEDHKTWTEYTWFE